MTEEPTPAITENKAPRSKKKYVWIGLGSFLMIFLVIPYWFTANPISCTRCHEMEKYYVSWQKSSHPTATKHCFKCHVKEGTVNTLIYRVAFYREIYASFTGAELAPFGATLPGTNSCHRSGCHSLNRLSGQSGDIKISHKEHVDKAHLTCPRCHPGAAHPNVGKLGKPTPSRKMCMQCHQATGNTCGFCHIKEPVASPTFKH